MAQIQIQIPISNKYLGCGYKSLVFHRNNGKHGQGTHCTKMDVDKSAENTPNAPEFICRICLSKPKSCGFKKKKASENNGILLHKTVQSSK